MEYMNDKIIKTRNGPIHFNPSQLNPYTQGIHTEETSTNKQSLTECMVFDYSKEMLLEQAQANPGKPLTIRGVFQRAGVKNQNGRVYTKEVLEREAIKYMENFIKPRRSLGELDHPDSSVVSLKNTSHLVTELAWNGDDLVGVIEILPTPNGSILKELLLSGVSVGISSRGMGTVKKNNQTNEDIVQDDFELIAFDLVSNPSVMDAGFQLAENRQPMNESVIPLITPEIENKLVVDSYNELLQNAISWVDRHPSYRQS